MGDRLTDQEPVNPVVLSNRSNSDIEMFYNYYTSILYNIVELTSKIQNLVLDIAQLNQAYLK